MFELEELGNKAVIAILNKVLPKPILSGFATGCHS